MSTISVGCLPASYYINIAACLAEVLTNSFKQRSLQPDDFPRMLLLDTRAFFDRVLDEQKERPQNHAAAISGFTMFAEVWESVCRNRDKALPRNWCESHTEIRRRVVEFSQFIQSIESNTSSRELTVGELVIVSDLIDFMEAFASKGRSVAYQTHMSRTFGNQEDD